MLHLDRKKEMDAFDKLPPVLQVVLHHTEGTFEASKILEVLLTGVPINEIVRYLITESHSVYLDECERTYKKGVGLKL
jgi:hypothetical protein